MTEPKKKKKNVNEEHDDFIVKTCYANWKGIYTAWAQVRSFARSFMRPSMIICGINCTSLGYIICIICIFLLLLFLFYVFYHTTCNRGNNKKPYATWEESRKTDPHTHKHTQHTLNLTSMRSNFSTMHCLLLRYHCRCCAMCSYSSKIWKPGKGAE